ncbi:MAG TPA: TIGR04283 family arsenosugar biosynthesis glycosyltransferase [Blastocatellia bacterium]|nr:TIGR04283 family arsenosugar biosynthesis glycosyltransferase [Blastocatellia bacterium]
MKLSVIIPVLNEREQLPITVARLQSHISNAEIIVVDGGSTDGTREWLQQQTGLIWRDAPRGRGLQMNAGASDATGEVLLFLHGDCILPAQAVALLQKALQAPQIKGGAFLIRFAEQAPHSLSIIAQGINARTRVTRTATGDQAIFVRRTVFDKMGGFAEWPLFEDVQFVTRLKRVGEFIIIPSPVTISARRYLAHGPWRTTFLMYALRLGYWLGIPPAKLYQWFQDVRPHLQNVA